MDATLASELFFVAVGIPLLLAAGRGIIRDARLALQEERQRRAGSSRILLNQQEILNDAAGWLGR